MKKYLLVVLIILIGWVYIGHLFSPGSYAGAETYELPITESELISIIQKFKRENQVYQVPSYISLPDHRDDHWYVIYFYFPEEKRIIYTWTRPSEGDKTTFALVSVKDGFERHWKKVEDLDRDDRRSLILKFEGRILDDIRERINF